jgi:hypothetical protein
MALTSEISAITQDLFLPKLVDQVFNSNALFQRMKKKNYRLIDGGTQIVQPLAYATTTSAGRYSGVDTLLVSNNDQFTSASFDWAQYYANITISRLDELKNSGKSAIVNYVKSKVEMAEKTLSNIMGTDLFSDGSTTNSFPGLALVCAATGTYGGIAKGSYSWWQGSKDTTTTVLTMAALQGGYGDVSIDNDKPTVGITTQDLFDSYYALLQPAQRFANAETANGGFTNLMFNGIPMIVDSHQASGDLMFLNEKYLELVAHSNENFRFEPFVKPVNQNVSTAKIYWAGTLVCSNCRMQKWFSALS